MVYINSTKYVPPIVPMHVDSNILIQVDATIIAGVLILLTIGSVFPFVTNRRISFPLTPATAVGVILFPFGLSIICLLYPDLINNSPMPDIFGFVPYAFGFALFSTIIGFIYMFFVIITIVHAEDIISRKRKKITYKIRLANKIIKVIKFTRIFSSEYRKRNKKRKLMIKKYKKNLQTTIKVL